MSVAVPIGWLACLAVFVGMGRPVAFHEPAFGGATSLSPHPAASGDKDVAAPRFTVATRVFRNVEPTHAAGLRPGEQVVFYPTPAWRIRGGWEAEVHGCVFELEKRAVLSAVLRRALGFDEDELSPAERAIFQARARAFLVDHQGGRSVSVRLAGETNMLGPSESNGHFSEYVQIKDEAVARRGGAGQVLRFETASLGGKDPSGTGEIHLLADIGLSVISDLDDTIKISAVRNRHELLRNTFCRPFRPVPGMAELYQSWARSAGAQFHYVSASPWQLYPPLAEFVRSNGFPAGTFHLKNFRVKDETFFDLLESPQVHKRGVIEPLLGRFPSRRFALVGDSGEQDPELYGALARRHPRQILRILIRDTTGEAPNSARYQRAFANLPPGLWKVFKEPAELERALR